MTIDRDSSPALSLPSDDEPTHSRRLDLDDRMDALERLQRMHHAEICTRLDALIMRLGPMVDAQRDLRERQDQTEHDIVDIRSRLPKRKALKK